MSLVNHLRPVLMPVLEFHAKWTLPVDLRDKSDPLSIKPVYVDLKYLHDLILKERPRTIWEFGSGFSTVAIWAAAKKDPEATLCSIETDNYWYDVTSRMMDSCFPSGAFVRLMKSNLLSVVSNGVPVVYHTRLPSGMPDFVYLDGPSGPHDGKEKRIAIDLLHLEDSLKPGFCLVIDGREANTQFLKDNFKRKWAWEDREFFGNHVARLLT